MRASVLAAAAAALAFVGVANAEQWTDPAGRFTFEAPNGWSVNQPPAAADNLTFVIAGTASNECQILAVTSPASAAASPESIRRQTADSARFTNDLWTRALSQFPDLSGDGVQITSTSVDETGFWPIQRAEAQAGGQPVHAAILGRPGVEVFVACLTYGGAPSTDLYNQVIRSIGHANDATWQTEPESPAAATP